MGNKRKIFGSIEEQRQIPAGKERRGGVCVLKRQVGGPFYRQTPRRVGWDGMGWDGEVGDGTWHDRTRQGKTAQSFAVTAVKK